MKPLRPSKPTLRPNAHDILTGLRCGATAAAEEVVPAMTNWKTFDLNLLVVFDAVMQEKNLTRAGQCLGLTQSAVSHALARLRHMLNDELFVRAPEGMVPTPRAERMADPNPWGGCRRCASYWRPMSSNSSQASHSFIISANNYAARAVIPAFVRHVAAMQPAERGLAPPS